MGPIMFYPPAPPPHQYPPAKASNSPVLIFEEATLTIGTIAIVGLN